MRRRDLLAGLGGAGIIGVAGAAHVYGMPFGNRAGEEPAHDPVAVQGVATTGSEAGELTIPASDHPTFVDLFATTCTICQAQMPALGEAYDTLDDVTFLSLTAEPEGAVDDEALSDWWDEYNGRWQVARDTTYGFVRHYSRATPTAVLFDADGRLRWEETGRKTAAEIIDRVEDVR